MIGVFLKVYLDLIALTECLRCTAALKLLQPQACTVASVDHNLLLLADALKLYRQAPADFTSKFW